MDATPSPLTTLTTDFGLSIRVSMFEYVRLVIGTSSGRAASGGALALETPRATRNCFTKRFEPAPLDLFLNR